MQKLTEQENAWEFNDREMKRLDIDYEGKSVLAIRVNLWFPYSNSVVENVSVSYFKKGDDEPVSLEKITVGRPFPNKCIAAAVTRVGRKQTKWFIPVVFDSLSELYDVERIKIEWKLKHNIASESAIYEYVIADYWVSVAKSEQRGVYGLWSYDTSCFDKVKPFSLDEGKILSKIKSEYNDFCLLAIREYGVEVLTECHADENGVDFYKLLLPDELDGDPDVVLTPTILQAIVTLQANERQDVLVTYYRTNVVLNDCGIIC